MQWFALAVAVVNAPGAVWAAKVTRDVPYVADGVNSEGFMVYDDVKCTAATKCPAVVIIQDWTGMDDYEKERACMVSDLGYVAFAADIYGVDTPKANFQHWMAASSSHSGNATKYMRKIHGAFAKVLEYDFVDAGKLAGIGYCFGGTGLVNVAMVGHTGFTGVQFPTGLLGVVSFHGGLSSGYAAPVEGTTRPKLLLHSGGKDDKNEDIEKLTDDLENVGAVYEITRYGSNVLHSFTEWSANSPGMAAYSPMADGRSWSATEHFLKELFTAGVSPVAKPSLSSLPSGFVEADVPYVADGVDCQGYMIYDTSKCSASSKCPAVMIVHDWTGMDDYEKKRAFLVAQAGYVAFAADIYGVNTPKATFQDWMAASSSHNNNATMYMRKIHGGLAKVMTYDFVDSSKIASVGYCFGGTGLINVAMAGYTGFTGIEFPAGLLGVVSFHGGLSRGYTAPQAGSRPQLLLHSGGQDDSNADISTLTDNLESVSAVYEITRYGPGVLHSFTEWDAATPNQAMYDARADVRSWADTMDFFKELFAAGGLGTTKPTAEQCDMNPSTQTVASGTPGTSAAVVLGLAVVAHCT